MHTIEQGITPDSDYYIHTPSMSARELFLYPTITGRFSYEAGYELHRARFEGFLLMYIERGSCAVTSADTTLVAQEGSFVLLDCRVEHGYKSRDAAGWRALWLHFDGEGAERFFGAITKSRGIVFALDSAQSRFVQQALMAVYTSFRSRSILSEGSLSLHIAAVLTQLASAGLIAAFGADFFALPSANKADGASSSDECASLSGVQRAASYMSEHYAEPLQLESLAQLAALSPFYFTRLFTKEIGMTPHQYLIATRLSAAKFLLLTTRQSVKEIAFQTGFGDENAFCICFKKHEQVTPTTYRMQNSSDRPIF